MSGPLSWLAYYVDPDGLPRAHASGKDKARVIALADKHLGLYRQEKIRLGDPLGFARYTLKVEQVGGIDGSKKTGKT